MIIKQTKGIAAGEREGVIYLDVPHQSSTISFVYPPFGPGDYFKANEALTQVDSKPASMPQNASLVYAAIQNPEDKYSAEVLNTLIMIYPRWGFTGILYVPGVGVFFEDNPQFKDREVVLIRNDLEKRLSANDPSVRFSEYGYETGEMTFRKLGNNSFVKGLVGEEGAEKLAEVAVYYRENPYLHAFSSADRETKLVSTFDGGRYFDWRLHVGGYDRGDVRWGLGFGVRASA